ncbi:phosphatase PAP2 family protein [Ruficoccus sp. ZRK36]|uniref:phosphatase PAP2 family protein n=1 Tax=Ruficoccus sp. ZRK36 TaxID=2866311 RepID=UPI001C72AC24|nr:phosphatase PAP2 family protein [Ruficoccus sp. ZRK36]QYY35915.1 phosphatase PAP2 family protein [Ruficoccus sp. ZRK36]
MIWIPLAVLAVVSLISWLTPVDMRLAQAFYGGGGAWPIGESRLWRMLYEVGPSLGIVLGAGAFLGFVGGFFWSSLRAWRLPLIFLSLAALIGPAVVVNFIFKDHYGRPRPREVVEFGGQQQYLEVWVPGKQKGHSFPSGHSSIAFYLMSPYFVFLASRRRLAYGFLFCGLAYGTIMGLARMVQGAHFMTDVVWAAGMVYLVDYALYYLLRLGRWRPPLSVRTGSRSFVRSVFSRPATASGSLSRRQGARP